MSLIRRNRNDDSWFRKEKQFNYKNLTGNFYIPLHKIEFAL